MENLTVCTECGEKSSTRNTYCPKCGNKLEHDGINLGKEKISLDKEKVEKDSYYDTSDRNNSDEYRESGSYSDSSTNKLDSNDRNLFISKNVYYYNENFEKITMTGNKKTWSWSAFFLGIYWFLYRKMYMNTAKIILASIVIGVSSAIIPYSGIILGLGFNILIGIYANSMYLDHVNKKLNEIESMGYDYKEREIIKKGGTNIAIPIALLIIQVVITIAIPLFALAMFSSMYYY